MAASAKILAYIFLVLGLLPLLRGIHGQYDQAPEDLDAHTGSAAFGEGYGYDEFTPDESDIKTIYGETRQETPQKDNGAGEGSNENDNLKEKGDVNDHVGNSEESSVHGAVDHNADKQDGHNIDDHEKHPGSTDNEKLTDEEVLRNELQREQEAANKKNNNGGGGDESKTNIQIREDLLRAQLHDSIQSMSEKKENDNTQNAEQNENNGNNNVRSNGDSNERPIKEIHDTVEQTKMEDKSDTQKPPSDHLHEANKHHEAERKEQKLKISKLIFAAKKNGDDTKHQDTPTSTPEGDHKSSTSESNGVSTNEQMSSDKGGNNGGSKQWVDEIIMTDGSIMRLRNKPNHLVDHHDDGNNQKSTSNDEQRNSDTVQETKPNQQESDKGENNESAGEEKHTQTDNIGQSVHQDANEKHDDTTKSRDGEQASEVQSNHEKTEEIHGTNTINQPAIDTQEHENKMVIDDEKIFESRRFIDMKNQYITKYLDDHYRDKQVSPQLLQQIVQLITSDLKDQWRHGQKEMFAVMEKRGHGGQDTPAEAKKEAKENENKQTNEMESTGEENDHQKNSENTEEHTHTHSNDEVNESKPTVESTKKSERPTRSFLSSMVRSSLSLAAHEKLHESSIATARSSSLALTMATKDSRSDVALSTASASVSDILSTAVSHHSAEENQQESVTETDKHVETGEIDATKSSDPGKVDDPYTDIFNESDKRDSDNESDDKRGKEEQGTPVSSGIDVSENETKQEDTNDSENISSEKKLIRAGDPFELSKMTDPDPKMNRWIQLPIFQDLRRTQVENYIDAQFAGKFMTEEELRGIDDLISKSMRKDLSDKNSGLRAWIMDSMGDENFEDDEQQESNATKKDDSKERSADSHEDKQEKSDYIEEAVTDEKSDYIEEAGTSKEAADIIKAKRKKLSDILSGSHSTEETDPSGAAPSTTSEVKEEEVVKDDADAKKDEENSDVNEVKDDAEKDGGSYLDSIWGFFGGSSDDAATEDTKEDTEKSEKDTKEDTEKSEKNTKEDTEQDEKDTKEGSEKPMAASGNDSEETDKDDEGSSDGEENITLSAAEDDEDTHDHEHMESESTKKPDDIINQETTESQPTGTVIANKTSEFFDTVLPNESDGESQPTSSSRPTASSTEQVTSTMAATTTTTETTEQKIIDESTREEFTTISPSSSSTEQISGTQKHVPENVESVDVEHEKLKYKKSDTGHDHVTGGVDADNEAAETDPLKKLCKKYPALKACQDTKPVAPIEETIEDTNKMDGSFASYIKYFTKWMNGWVYAVFAYIVQCVKSLVRVLCVSTVGAFLNLLGRDEISSSVTEEFDAITTEHFAVYMFLFISYASFGWYYKNSTMTPIIKVGDGFQKKDDKKVENAEGQLNDLKKKMEKEKNDKEKTQKQLEKEVGINQQMHQENKELKKYIEETKGDKKRIKELTGSIKDHDNKMKGKDKELAKLRLSVQTIKDDLKEHKDKYKVLEDKFRYVEKESDSKDDTIAELEDRKKELESQLNTKNKDVTEKGELLDDLNGRVKDLQEKQNDLEENMKKEKEITQKLEDERKALQETLLNIDKINYEGKLENGFHNIEGEDGSLNVSMDDDVKAERLQNIINAIKLKAEHLEAVTELNTCKQDLSVYRTKSDELEVNMNDLSSKFERISTESEELKKGIEKKNIELQTITKFFGEREAEYQRLNVTQKEEIQKLSKQMDLIGDEKREMSELIKKIDELKEEIEKNQKDYKQQLATVEEQSHANYLKMRNAIRECDEHKREKEVYRKRLLDIDMTPQTKPKLATVAASLERSDSPSSNKSTEALPDTSAGKPGQQPVPSTAAPPFGGPPMFRRGVPQFPSNPMASALYRVPPVGPYGMPPGRPPFMPPMRPPMPPNAQMNRGNVPPMNVPPMNQSNTSMAPQMGQPNASMAPQMGQPNTSMTNAPMGANIPMSAPNAQMNSQYTPMNPSGANMNSSNPNISQPAMVPHSYSTPGQHMPPGHLMSTPPRMPGPRPYGFPPGVPMMPNQSTPNIMAGAGHPTNIMQTPGSVAAGGPLPNA